MNYRANTSEPIEASDGAIFFRVCCFLLAVTSFLLPCSGSHFYFLGCALVIKKRILVILFRFFCAEKSHRSIKKIKTTHTRTQNENNFDGKRNLKKNEKKETRAGVSPNGRRWETLVSDQPSGTTRKRSFSSGNQLEEKNIIKKAKRCPLEGRKNCGNRVHTREVKICYFSISNFGEVPSKRNGHCETR